MTIPWLGNCPHSPDGWCLDCVKTLGEHHMEQDRLAESRYLDLSAKLVEAEKTLKDIRSRMVTRLAPGGGPR